MPTVVLPGVSAGGYDVQRILDYCGRILRQAREQQGLGLVAVAARAGISKTHLADIETGKRGASFTTILRLAHALGVPFADLVPPEGPSVLSAITLEIHARGQTFAEHQLALLQVTPDCLPRRRSA